MITKNLVLTIIAIVSGSSFQFGFQTGVINAPMKYIENYLNKSITDPHGPFKPNIDVNTLTSIAVALFPIGGLIGALLGGSVSNRFGRKKSILIVSLPTIIACVLMAISKTVNFFPCLFMGRFIIGISCGLYTNLAPMYLSEVAPLKIRGAAGTINQFFVVIGVLVSQILGLENIMGNEKLWPYLLSLSIIPCVFQMIILLFCPESPRYLLLVRNDHERTVQSLQFLRNSMNIQGEMDEMLQEKEYSRSLKSTLSTMELFKRKYLRSALIVSVVMQLSQQFSGINAVINYSDKMFLDTGLNEQLSNYATLGVGITNVLITFVSVLIVDKVGRKSLHLTGLIGMLINAILLSFALIFADKWSGFIYCEIVFVFLYVASFGIGPGAIPWFIVAEMFTQESRGSAMTIAVFVNWMGQIVIGLAYPQLLKHLAKYSFLPFVGALAIFALYTWKYLPETKGRTPDEMEAYFKRRVDGISVDTEPLTRSESVGPIIVEDDDDLMI